MKKLKILRHYIKLFGHDSILLAFVLSDRSLVRATLSVWKLWIFLITRKTFLRGKLQKFDFIYKGKRFNLQLSSAIDIAVLCEVFVDQEYEWDIEVAPKKILDLGAHWGDTSIYYALKYPDAVIYSVEPSPDIFKRLIEQTQQFNTIVPICGALGPSSGKQTFYISENSLGNSMTQRSVTDSAIEVEVFTFADLCRNLNVEQFDLVKFDIEGGEQYIFNDPEIKKNVKAFIGEVHLDLMNISLQEIEEYFRDFNVNFQKIGKMRYIIKAIKS